MTEANLNDQRDSSNLDELIRELELQVESVNAGLSRIRGTVARIAYASRASANSSSAASWGGASTVVPANQWSVSPPAASPVMEPSPVDSFGFETAIPAAPADSEPAAPGQGFWDSVAEGASWPRAHTDGAAAAETTPVPSTSSVDPWSWPGSATSTERPAPDASQSPEAQASNAFQPEEPAVEATPSVQAEAQADAAAEGELQAWMLEAAVQAPEPEESGPAASGEPVAPPSVGGQMPPTLSSGWPDESAWSQSFEWPAMKPETPQVAADAPTSEPDEARADVSDIVAQVRAELELARAQGMQFTQAFEDETTDAPTGSAEAHLESDRGQDDDARREEVSRAVAEMRAQMEAGDFTAWRDDAFGAGDTAWGTATGGDAEQEQPAQPLSEDDDLRAEVRRAVEATREELAGGRELDAGRNDKPAFRLAAPGSLPDWSHMQMEPSGPPVVVMKDADGRVELASVYETLNELGCGDGAALLNYTPHSVTVGLPISAQFPSKERIAEAVEKVFGLTSRVESDGVRITVSIGVDPRHQRSVGAA